MGGWPNSRFEFEIFIKGLDKREDVLAYLNQPKETPTLRRKGKVILEAKHLNHSKEEEDITFDVETLKKQLERGKF